MLLDSLNFSFCATPLLNNGSRHFRASKRPQVIVLLDTLPDPSAVNTTNENKFESHYDTCVVSENIDYGSRFSTGRLRNIRVLSKPSSCSEQVFCIICTKCLHHPCRCPPRFQYSRHLLKEKVFGFFKDIFRHRQNTLIQLPDFFIHNGCDHRLLHNISADYHSRHSPNGSAIPCPTGLFSGTLHVCSTLVASSLFQS